ncbi:uncharacterized protein LOC128987992 isoform X2 [Macrosteles quadrilineatus]|uniref:uncharacterized protein LOC128987992 isoform X1 n=1 Tax=Macrosteles quadrilineatus TaxID=74068 RepID=UPI0023E2BA87|nr:uncharacterized protein LOC128987992 isoform X1 [Macrosteles quadrilineatus]XP_054265139.1 uncharacterized protein LOC128987992 isoform X2 [Macrosteles quadrilineatus]
MPADVLQEIPPSAINYFCNNVLKRDWPNSIHVYYFVKTMTEWKNNHADVRVSLLCMEGDVEDGTFVGLLYSELGGCTVLAYTQQESCERLGRALRETRRIKWSEPLTFEAVLQRHAATVHRAAHDHGLETSIYAQSGILYMPHDQARKLRPKCISDEVYVAPLQSSHVPYIHSVWAHNDIYTLQELESTLRLNGGYGVFDAADDTLLCWAMHTHYGGVGVLQTRDGCGGKGYARLVSACLSQALGLMGIAPHVCIKDTNTRSLSLFRSIGYEHVSSIQYITTHDPSSSSSESSS